MEPSCRKCDQPIRREQWRFGSEETGWEHVGECIAPDRGGTLAGRLRQIAERIDADGTFGARLAADDLREAADLLDRDLGGAPRRRVTRSVNG